VQEVEAEDEEQDEAIKGKGTLSIYCCMKRVLHDRMSRIATQHKPARQQQHVVLSQHSMVCSSPVLYTRGCWRCTAKMYLLLLHCADGTAEKLPLLLGNGSCARNKLATQAGGPLHTLQNLLTTLAQTVRVRDGC